MKKKCLLLLLLPLFCFSQYEKQIDSLQKLISKAKNIDEKGNAYTELALIYLDSDIQKATPILDKLKALNKNNECPKCEAYSWLYRGHMTARLGKIKESIPIYEKAYQKAKTFDDDYIYLKAKAHIAQSLLDLNKSTETEKLLLSVVDEYKTTPKQIGLEDFYYLLGSMNYEKKNLNKALDYFIQSESIIKATDPDGVYFKIAILSEITHIYSELKNKNKAFETNQKALDISKKPRMR
jgi:tetratricopeptide (TPR) repeat protein